MITQIRKNKASNILTAQEESIQTLKVLRDQFEEYLEDKAFDTFPNVLRQPSQHIMGIKGKRIRPLMLLTACQVFGGNVEEAMGPASAVEIFHNFSLVHDDIIDNADTRRGQASVHKTFGLNRAILVGDAMLLHSFIQLGRGAGSNLPDLLKVFNKSASEVIEGEQYDVEFEDIPEVSMSDYMMMIKNKTSVLLAASLQLGSIIGNASAEDQVKIYDFGLNLGLAFQIKDDYLDSFGDVKTFGKRIGGDILQNKKTFLLITALDNASDEEKKKIFNLFEQKDEEVKIREMLEIYNRLEVDKITHSRMEELYKKSLNSLNDLSIGEEASQPLRMLASMIYNRDY